VIRRYINYFQPSMKLVHRVRTGARMTKTYDRAQTPCERLLASPEVAESSKAALRVEFHCLDPCVLLAEIERLQEALWRLAKPDLLPTSRLATQPGSDPTRCAQSQGAISPSIAPAEAQTPKRRHYRRAQRPRCPHIPGAPGPTLSLPCGRRSKRSSCEHPRSQPKRCCTISKVSIRDTIPQDSCGPCTGG
jgi:hypothetical protein